jgi:hypothetical protein
MQLPDPITIQPPTITRPNGEVRVQKPITLSKLRISVISDLDRKVIRARIHPLPKPITLWEGAAYDALNGEISQAQIEEKIAEFLGDDPKAALEGLF